MWTHVSDETLMDVVEGAGGDRALGHVATCARCRERVDDVRSALGLTARAALPEPAPIFWDVMRRRIAQRLAEVPPARTRRPLWAAAAVAGAAMVVLATGVGIRPTVEPPLHPTAALPAWSALPPADQDPGLPVLENIAPTMAAASPSVECPDLAECVAGLSDDESRALAAALREKIAQGRTL
jgi:hypothetical protein